MKSNAAVCHQIVAIVSPQTRAQMAHIGLGHVTVEDLANMGVVCLPVSAFNLTKYFLMF